MVLHEGDIQSVLTVKLDIGAGEQFDALFVESTWEWVMSNGSKEDAVSSVRSPGPEQESDLTKVCLKMYLAAEVLVHGHGLAKLCLRRNAFSSAKGRALRDVCLRRCRARVAR